MTFMEPKDARKRLSRPPVDAGVPGSLVLDNYIIAELFFREDHPEYFTEHERTFAAIVESARLQREHADSGSDAEEE
jgi:hypothetical protein